MSVEEKIARAAGIRRSIARGTLTADWSDVAVGLEAEIAAAGGQHAAPGAVLAGAGDRAPIGQDGASVVADRRESFSAGESTSHTSGCSCDDGGMTRHYLSLQGVADHLGVSRNTVAKYRLPEPDVIVGDGINAPRGWSVATINRWNESRRGQGWRRGQVAESKP